MRCTCDIHVVCMWYPCGVHVISMWCTCDIHVVCMWYPCGVHVISMWCACDIHVVCMWYPCGVHVISKWKLTTWGNWWCNLIYVQYNELLLANVADSMYTCSTYVKLDTFSNLDYYWNLGITTGYILPIGYNRGRKRFADFWILHQIFHRFTLNFVSTPFQVLKAWNIMCKNMETQNPSRCSLAPHLKWRYFQI